MTTANTEERQEQREEIVSDERILGRLEGRVGLLNENVQAAERRSEERYLALAAEIAQSNRDLSAKIDALNANLSAKIDAVRSDSSTKIVTVNAKIDTVNTNLSAKIDTVNTNLTDKIDDTSKDLIDKIDTVNTNLSDKIDKTSSELNGRFILLLVGVVVAIVGGYIGMAIALFQIAATR